MWYIYTIKYYSAIKNNEFMKFLGKWMEFESVILSEVTQSRKNTHGMHSLISGYLNKQDTIHGPQEAQEEGRPKCGCIGFSEKRNKILTGAIMETSVGQRLKERPPRDCTIWGFIL